MGNYVKHEVFMMILCGSYSGDIYSL